MESNAFPESTPQHNWDSHHWNLNNRPDRLYQGPFPLELVPDWDVVMTTMPSTEPVPNYGMGLMAYVIGDMLPIRKDGESVRQTIEKIAQIPMASKLYIRPTWRQMQSQRGRLDLFEHWQVTLEMAAKYNQRLGFRIMLANPDAEGEALPDFILENVPMFYLGTGWEDEGSVQSQDVRACREHRLPHYHHPYFLEALEEFDALLAERYNGHADIEFIDTYMYGFWGEGHSWPFDYISPFPDHATALETWLRIFEMQRAHWDKTPLVTNTQPDLNHVGNAELLERTIRSGNWIRTDTIFIENQQIEALSNRPAHIATICEVGMSDGSPASLQLDPDGIPLTENIIAHVIDVGANYWSLWNWHNIHADHIMNYYRQFPQGIDRMQRVLGYRLRPSWIWQYNHAGRTGLVLGLVNDGIAGVPGSLYLSLLGAQDEVVASGSLDAGYPIPHRVRQARFILPPGIGWEGLRLKAELEVKGVRHPLRWACRQALNIDGTLTLKKGEIIS
ncbi:MAG: hypothetical protein AB1894_19690 [Chloroflexota bacterium]